MFFPLFFWPHFFCPLKFCPMMTPIFFPFPEPHIPIPPWAGLPFPSETWGGLRRLPIVATPQVLQIETTKCLLLHCQQGASLFVFPTALVRCPLSLLSISPELELLDPSDLYRLRSPDPYSSGSLRGFHLIFTYLPSGKFFPLRWLNLFEPSTPPTLFIRSVLPPVGVSPLFFRWYLPLQKHLLCFSGDFLKAHHSP